MIHASGSAENSFQSHQEILSSDFLAVFLSQFSRFCVPVFVLLSGYGLASKFKTPLNAGELKEFALRRLSRIVLPYFLWTVAILALTGQFRPPGQAEDLLYNLETLLPFLYRQGADYHFYFFSIIIQCYLLFPLLLFPLQSRRHRYATLLFLLPLTLLYASPAHLLFQELAITRPSFFSAFFIYWILYFYLGMILAREKEALQRIFSGPVALSSGCLFLTLMILEYVYWSRRAPDPGHYNHFTRITVILYSISFISIYARYAQRWIAAWPDWLRDGLVFFASLSFTIYIIHTWVLRVVQQEFFLLSFLFTTVASLGISYALHRLISGRWRILRLILGLPDR